MWKGMIVGALALVTASATNASAEGSGGTTPTFRPVSHTASTSITLTSARIARIKAALKLTPAQERYWPPVEAALRELMRHQAREGSGGDAAVRADSRKPAIDLDSAHLHRIGAAAMPLIMSLGEEQKRDALRLARAMGLGKVVSLF